MHRQERVRDVTLQRRRGATSVCASVYCRRMSGGAPCAGCGVVLADHDGPTHPEIGASAACWALYGELLTHEYAERGFPECHRLTVDAYAVQHPGTRGSKSIKSLGTHLAGLYLVL